MTNQLIVKMVLDAWYGRVKEADAILQHLTDEQLQNEVAPGKNTGMYLLGHLTSVHDKMLPLLNLGEENYPQLTSSFIRVADSKTYTISAAELREFWKNANTKLAEHFSKMPAEAWFERHTSVSAEDFQKEPHRNKLNLIINRTGHLAYHAGQLVLLKK